MTQHPAAQLASRPPETEPTVAELLDPVALERRLVEARARRAEALARRRSDDAPAGPAPPSAPEPAPAPPEPLVADGNDQPVAPAPRRRRPLPMAAMFIGGLCLGAAVTVLAPAALRDRAAEPATPEAPAPPAVAEAGPPAAATAAAAPPPAPPPAGPPDAPAAGDPAVAVAAPPPVAEPAAPEAIDVAAAAPDAAPPAPEPAGAAMPAWAAGTRVFLHHPPDARAEAEAAAEALRTAGVAEVALVAAPLSVARTNVRFYHAGDAAAARGVATLLATADAAPPEARDFTHFSPPPEPGMVEVWLAGEAPAPRTAGAPAPSPGSAAEAVAEQVARILIERAVESLRAETVRR
jgi:hypothetical protein